LTRNQDKKAIFHEKPRISQGLPVRKKMVLAAGFIFMLFFSASATTNFVKPAQANPYHRWFKGTEVPPPAGTQPPSIIIHTPQNGSYYSKNLNLTFDVIIPNTNGDKSISAVIELYYKASWEPNEIAVTQKNFFGESTSFSVDLSGLRGGNHSITIYAVGQGSYNTREEFDANSYAMIYYYEVFEMACFSTVSFIKDVVSPIISFLSPQNGTYITSDVKLDFTVSEATSEILYCLDGKENQTVTDSLNLTGLAEGAHNVALYAADLAGNAAVPQTLFLNVDVPELFSASSIPAFSVATVAVVGVGLLVYFKRRKR
jgi:hypothetical protein